MAYALWAPEPERPSPPPRVVELATTAIERAPQPLYLQGFNAPFWSPPAPDVMTERAQTPAAPSPVRLELVGIVSEPDPETGESLYFAAIFDPETHRLFVVGSGDEIGEYDVESVGGGAVALRRGDHTVRLELDEWRLSGSGT